MSKATYQELRGFLDGNDPFMTGGHQIQQIRQGWHSIPDWTQDDQKIQELLLRTFPKLNTDSRQREQAGRWIRVIYLYYRSRLTHGQIAVELGVNLGTILSLIRSITRVSSGRRANGSGMKTRAIIETTMGETAERTVKGI